MRNIWVIARREYVERVKTPAFIIMTLLVFVVMVVGPMVPAFFAGRTASATTTIAVVDETGAAIVDRLAAQLDQQGLVLAEYNGAAAALAAADEGEVDGVLQVSGQWPHAVAGQFSSSSVFVLGREGQVHNALESLVREDRVRGLGLDAATAAELFAPLTFESRQLGTDADEEGFAVSMGAGFVVTMLIYMGVLIYGAFVFQGVLEEKSSRVMEVMASSVRPFELMAGKILGLGSLGLTSYVTWVAAYLVLTWFGASLVGLDLSAITPAVMLYVGIFFILGYFLYASLFAAAGSLISRMEDAGTVQMPITFLVILMMIFSNMAISNPNGSLARIFSLIPFFSPTVMMNRILLGSPPFWEILLSIAFLALGVLVMTWVASRIYRAGILTYGSRPTLKQVLRYLRS